MSLWRWIERASWIAGLVGGVVATIAFTSDYVMKDVDSYFLQVLQRLPEDQRQQLEPLLHAMLDGTRSAVDGKKKSEDIDRSARKLSEAFVALSSSHFSVGNADTFILKDATPVTVCANNDTLSYRQGPKADSYRITLNDRSATLTIGEQGNFRGKKGTVRLNLMQAVPQGLAIRIDCPK